MSRGGPLPAFEKMTFSELRDIGKASVRVLDAFDSGRRDPTNDARVRNFERRVDELRAILAPYQEGGRS